MRQVLAWTEGFVGALLEAFDYKIFNLSSDVKVDIDDVASKRFLFYSLEKEITLQSYVFNKEYKKYEGAASWEMDETGGVLVQNDPDGGCLTFYTSLNAAELIWMREQLKEFSLDEVAFEVK